MPDITKGLAWKAGICIVRPSRIATMLGSKTLATREVAFMKEGIHPKYFKATVTCGCGHSLETGSTKEKIAVEICSNCHPFFTGTQKFVDTAGRVERFQRKYKKT